MNGCKEELEKGEVESEYYIDVYSRADAIRDGELIDVSEVAKEAGFRYPVALTRAVFVGCVEVPFGVQGQDESGRLWDVLWMTRFAIRRARGSNIVPVSLYVRTDNGRPRRVTLKALCGPGDTPDPVITIMYPDED